MATLLSADWKFSIAAMQRAWQVNLWCASAVCGKKLTFPLPNGFDAIVKLIATLRRSEQKRSFANEINSKARLTLRLCKMKQNVGHRRSLKINTKGQRVKIVKLTIFMYACLYIQLQLHRTNNKRQMQPTKYPTLIRHRFLQSAPVRHGCRWGRCGNDM